MAYYPLKVKDSGGTVHVVGDPRIADKADKNSPALTGTPTAPTAAADTNTTQVATTAFVVGQAAASTPAALGTAAVGSSTRFARADHVHAAPTAAGIGAAPASHTHTSSQVPTIDLNTQAGSYTLVLADAGKTILMNSGSAQTLTVPTNASVAFPVGTKIDVIRSGAGECNVASSATLLSEGSKKKINAQNQAVTLVKTDTDTWYLVGALKA